MTDYIAVLYWIFSNNERGLYPFSIIDFIKKGDYIYPLFHSETNYLMNRHALAYYRRVFLLICFIPQLSPIFGQISKGGYPLSISQKISIPIPTQELPQPDWAKIQEEDKGQFRNFRFAVPIEVNFTTDNSGKWIDAPNGGRIWQLSIHSNKALGLAVAFDNFELAEGSKLFFYSPDHQQVLGAFDADNNPESRRFLAPFIKGDEVVVEYYEPKKNKKSSPFKINQVYHAYPNGQLGAGGFGQSFSCEINANCSQGTNWQTQKKGVVRILLVVKGGMGWCSGSLINNTQNNGTPYVLSAFHCDDGYIPDHSLWTFYFNYESPDCGNPSVEPTAVSIQGCTVKAGLRATDFQLLELSQKVPNSANAYFNGWSRDTNNLTTSNVMIHHPQGDIKKISIDNQAPTVMNDEISWSGAVPHNSVPRTHLTNVFDEGGMEPGSSGSPIFDANGRIIAQLHGGGYVECKVNFAYSGWLAKSWEGGGSASTRLKDWLDPTNSGVMTLGGTNNPTPSVATVSGKVLFWNNSPLPNVKVYFNNDSTLTNSAGEYSFSNVPLNTNITIKIDKPDNYDNGADAADLVLIRRHILGITDFNSAYKSFCGDINGGGDVDAADILLLRRLIVGINASFPNTTPWRFFLKTTATNSAFPNTLDPSPLVQQFTNSVTNLDFYGFKKGDVNGSADLGQ